MGIKNIYTDAVFISKFALNRSTGDGKAHVNYIYYTIDKISCSLKVHQKW